MRAERPEDEKDLGWGSLPESGLGIGNRRAQLGIWLRWDGKGKEPVRVWVRLDVAPSSTLSPLVRRKRGPLPPLSRWVQAVRHNGSHRDVLLELRPATYYELLFVDLRDFHMYGELPYLREDPDDTRPLGNRTPVIASHGLLWDSPHLRLSGMVAPLFINALKRHPTARKLRNEIKWYAFDYPAWRHPSDNGSALARQARAMLEREAAVQPAVMVGHSMGGLVQRYALNHRNFGDDVKVSISAGTPHHGAFIMSLAATTCDLRQYMSAVDVALIRQGFGNLMPDCPGARGLWWDNFDGAFNRDTWKCYEFPVNPELARFNRDDAYLSKLLCMAGDCPKLGFNHWLSPHERVRWCQGNYFEGFGNVDPFVPLSSSTLEGAPVERRIHPGADHLGWALWAWQVGLLMGQVESRL